MKQRWKLLAAAKPRTITSIDPGIRTFTAVTVQVEPLTLLAVEQFDMVQLMGLKNGKDPASQMRWIEGLLSLFETRPEVTIFPVPFLNWHEAVLALCRLLILWLFSWQAFPGDLIVVEEQLKRGAMGHRMCELACVTLTYWKTMGRQVTSMRPISVHAHFADQDARDSIGHSQILREKGYAGNKARASHWLKGFLSTGTYDVVSEVATKKGKDDDIADAFRQALFAAHLVTGANSPAKSRQRQRTKPPATKSSRPRSRPTTSPRKLTRGKSPRKLTPKKKIPPQERIKRLLLNKARNPAIFKKRRT